MTDASPNSSSPMPPSVVRRGYRLHITRRADWKDASSGPPITRAEFNDHFRDRLLGYGLRYRSGNRWRLWITPHPSMEVFMIFQPGGEIVCGLPSQARLHAIVAAARAVGARVVGDEGEEYGPDSPLPVEQPEDKLLTAWQRIEFAVRGWIVIGAFLFALAWAAWAILYFFGYL